MITISPEQISSNQLITAIIYGTSVLFPSAIAIITLIKKNYFNKGLKQLFNKVETGFKQNQTSIQQIKTTLVQHTKSIQNLLQNRNIANRLREIVKHALVFCGNNNLSKILEVFIQQFISFVIDIIQIGFANTCKQQILAKMTIVYDNTNKLIKQSFTTAQQLRVWNNYALPCLNNYLNEVYNIYEDKINNKNSRFLVKSEDFAQTLIRQFIVCVNRLNFTIQNSNGVPQNDKK